ncbi:MAG: nitroreductase [Bacteroidetes bacterium]|jgi:nitroreductase|nr:nitroreductase [Bacteroidota bacterium]MBT5530375.1 nitroreductase [Cytophagia bacterium]MBT3424458.1 nitroreductase [Bacteroidota bacterium]MBT3801893.1 nitroreductase [Bacteroidota bacterium]MBT3935092.1 nitroreductase [Bacteroidota bacterium]
MSFLELAKKRYSCRDYLNKEVEVDKLKSVLEAGRIAPSAANRQPWIFIVIRNPEIRKMLHDTYKRDWFTNAPVIIVACGNHEQSWVRTSDSKDHCDVDISIALDHMTLAATEVGLASCWICAFDAKMCHELLELPAHIEPIALLPMGYPVDEADTERHIRQRKAFEDVVFWERYP